MTDRNTPSIHESLVSIATLNHARDLAQLALVFTGLVLFVGTAAAQPPGEALCNTDMARTIQNIFTLIQFGGPLLGGVLALGATVALPFVRRSDWKKEIRGILDLFPALKRHDETLRVSLHPKTRSVFEDEDSSVGNPACAILPAVNVRVR
jgi:hypothetical protein